MTEDVWCRYHTLTRMQRKTQAMLYDIFNQPESSRTAAAIASHLMDAQNAMHKQIMDDQRTMLKEQTETTAEEQT